ncbi:M14 family zinc carboxypeptidase [Allorhizocola rhizosphaerae]|uniref:M14 family zinc carboxypeptidase n=1 Tax=Allorhizocola rhizosphaerae TaxID=1872709 RepID=UPI000E3CCC50|nr:M14 family zinc carboxypeptidase [Allorhizocola rhizosphaerae]
MRLLLALALAVVAVATPAGVATAQPEHRSYAIRNVKTLEQDEAVRKAGMEVDYFEHGILYVKGKPEQASALRKQGFKVDDLSLTVAATPVDPGYTDFAEMAAEVNRIAGAFPALVSKSVIGQSFEGRDLHMLKISDNVGTDEDEPEMLFTANQHAREHLTVEMALALANLLTTQYGVDPKITEIVNTREIWIIPMVNPDGVTHDLGGANYQHWRKNRQRDAASNPLFTDLNRNWAYKWGCCGGSSGSKSSDTYRGPSAFSAPEAKAVKDFVLTRRVGGVQQIKLALDIHTFSELVLWPFGYTTSTVVSGMTADQYNVHKAIGTEMALSNGYWPAQASGLYITDGSIDDWLWGDQKIFSFTFEMFPKESNPLEFYPPASVIPVETSRNRDALVRFATWADCPYRSIGKEAANCPAANDYSLTAPATATVAQGGNTSFSLSAAKTAGADQLVSLSATGMPAGATVGFSSFSVPTDGSAHTVTINTTAATTQGTYTVVITGVGSAGTVRTTRVTLTVTGKPECTATNGTDLSIPDGTSKATSTVTIASCGGNGHTTATVQLKVVHSYIGDLRVNLISPSGTTFALHDRNGGPVNNIDRLYTLDLSGEAADGVWKLDLLDGVSGDSGKLDTWTLTLR